MRQEHRGRHVGDRLAGQNAEKERIERHQRTEKFPHGGDTREVSRKHEKSAKRQKQSIIHAQQRFPIQNEYGGKHGEQSPIIGKEAENDAHGENEQQRIGENAPYGRRRFGARAHFHALLLYEQAHAEDQCERGGKGQRHDFEKFRGADLVKRIQVQILGIAERREHTAEIGGDILHNESKREVLSFAARIEHEKTERQKSDERHVVRHDHRAEIGDGHERKHDAAHALETPDDLIGEPHEKFDILERPYHSQRTEEARERAQIEVIQISPVDGNENTGDPRRRERDPQHRAVFHNM